MLEEEQKEKERFGQRKNEIENELLSQRRRIEEFEKENAELKKHIDEIKKYKICPRCTRSDVQKLEKENAELREKLEDAEKLSNPLKESEKKKICTKLN